MTYSVSFPSGTVQYHMESSFAALDDIVAEKDCIILTDRHIAGLYQSLLSSYRQIVIEPGEQHKTADTIADITKQLLAHQAHRKTTLIALGGGMITDIGGFAASVYMRGIPFGFIPTTVLGMVDAAIGGKNGINYGLQKNLLGTINQPRFILYDTSFLQTLPATEWSNGFAEVIKYACLFDKPLFEELSKHSIEHYINDTTAVNSIINTCVAWKNKTVQEDEKETGNRKLLNFGHTAGHAFETLYHLSHGYAVGLGMLVACIASEKYCGLNEQVRSQIENMLAAYNLPTTQQIDVNAVLKILQMDKKRNDDTIDYILLNDIASPVIKPLSITQVQEALLSFSHASNR